MIPGFEGTPRFGGIGDHARVKVIDDQVLILAVDAMRPEKPVTISMTPEQARDLADGIIEAAIHAEAQA